MNFVPLTRIIGRKVNRGCKAGKSEKRRYKVGVTHLKHCCAPLQGNSMVFLAEGLQLCFQVVPFIVQDQS